MNKENYFSLENIEEEALIMLRELEPDRQKTGFRFSPRRSALLVLDMQRYFLDSSSHAFVPSSQAIIPGLNSLIQAYSGNSLPVLFTRHINTSQNAGMMARWWRELIFPENPLSEISPAINTIPGTIIPKNQYDAFFETLLEEFLRAKQVSQVVIGGVMTHLCCESTARSAFIRGFEVFFLVDGTATYNAKLHKASLQNLAHGFAVLSSVRDIQDGF
jgi:bifunctional isochorismate lyase/aryl carrier protein